MDRGFDLDNVLTELAGGNKDALENLFNFYYPRLYQFSMSFLKLEDGIDDILQEVFIKIWNNRANIRAVQTFNPFIFTITRNLLLNELRSRLNKQKIKDQILKVAIPEEFQAFESVEFRELEATVDKVVAGLPERQREVFLLSRKEGLSHREISERLNISTKTVEYHITQSVSAIKTKLKEFGLISLLYFYLFF